MGRFLRRMLVPVWTHATREEPRGVQVVFDLQILLAVVCLKAGEHEF
jgi:hypothetical protein